MNRPPVLRHISLTNLIESPASSPGREARISPRLPDDYTPRNDPACIPPELITPHDTPRSSNGSTNSSPRDKFGSTGSISSPRERSASITKPNLMPFVLISVEDNAKLSNSANIMLSLTPDQMMIQDEFNRLVGNLRMRFDSSTKLALINYCSKLERMFPMHNPLLERLYKMVLRIEAEITGHFLFDSGLLYPWVHYCQYCNEQWLVSLCDAGTNFNINVPLTHIYNCAYYIPPTRKMWAANAIYGRIEREPAAISLLAAMFAAGACCKVPPSIGAKIFAEHKKHARLVRFYVSGAIWKRAARERKIGENVIGRVMDML